MSSVVGILTKGQVFIAVLLFPLSVSLYQYSTHILIYMLLLLGQMGKASEPTPWSRVLPEKLIARQLFKISAVFYGTQRFITAITTARHLSLS